jgi:hypothetical protein
MKWIMTLSILILLLSGMLVFTMVTAQPAPPPTTPATNTQEAQNLTQARRTQACLNVVDPIITMENLDNFAAFVRCLKPIAAEIDEQDRAARERSAGHAARAAALHQRINRLP